jgi:hypothetical protein
MSTLKMSWAEEAGQLVCRWSERTEHRRYVASWTSPHTLRRVWLPPRPSQFDKVFGVSLAAIQWCVPIVGPIPRFN